MRGAIVTGAAKGLGREIALSLAKRGFAVAINYRTSKKEAEAMLRQLRKINKNCIAVSGDLTKESDVKQLVELAQRKFERVDVLINNIGDFLYKPILQTTKKELVETVENNVATVLLCSKVVFPLMKEQKYGRIVNIGSVGCTELLSPDNTTAYYIGKTGVWLLTKSLARNAPENVTVNMVSPGILRTSMVKPEGATYTEFEEVADAMMLLIDSSHNGKNITVAKWKPEG